MSIYELEFKLLRGGYIGDYMGSLIGLIKGDTWSLNSGSCAFERFQVR